MKYSLVFFSQGDAVFQTRGDADLLSPSVIVQECIAAYDIDMSDIDTVELLYIHDGMGVTKRFYFVDGVPK